MISAWENLVAKTGKKLEVLTLAFSSNKVSILTKILIAFAFLYAASPIDIIPDSVPFFGNVDDVIIVPIGYALAKLTMKKEVWTELNAIAEEETVEIQKKHKIIGGCLVGTLTLALLMLIIYLIVR